MLAEQHVRRVELLDFPELGMEAVRLVEVVDFPAFVLIDDRGEDLLAGLSG